MKRITSVILLLLLAAHANAQKIRFTDTTNRWMVYYQYFTGTPMSPTFHNAVAKYQYTGTETHGGKVYSKLSSLHYGGLFRDDTAANVVYRFNTGLNKDEIVFDYNKQVGDTIDAATQYNIITKVDSIQIQNVWHKTFEFYNTTITYTGLIIEGIGYTYNVSAPSADPQPRQNFNHIICFTNNGTTPIATTIPKLFEPNRCADSTLSVASAEYGTEVVKIFPQPAHEQLSIELPMHFSSGKLILVSLTGRVVYQYEFEDETRIVVANPNSPGIYFYRLVNNDGEMVSGKVLFE